MDYTRRSFLGLVTAAGGLTMAPAGSLAALAGGSETAKTRWHSSFGINANNEHQVRSRLQACGRIGVARVFYSGMLPRTWSRAEEGASPQFKCQVSFKENPAAIAAGHHDERILSWLESIPAGWCVYLTFWHEPNDELRTGRFSGHNYRAAWSRLSTLVRRRARLHRNVIVRLVPVFMSYEVGKRGFWSNSWVPRPSEVSFISWDIYGNPSGGSGLEGQYPSVQSCIDPCLHVNQTLGFQHWGVSEFNTPTRTWDAGESARRRWLTEFTRYATSTQRRTAPRLGAPRTLMLWEGDGTNWNQSFKTKATWNWWSNVTNSR